MNRNTFIVTSMLFLAASYIIYPAMTYHEGTTTDITVEVVAEPFVGGNELVYRWSGVVSQSCDITIRKRFIDSAGVVTTLVPKSYEAMPKNHLGDSTYEVTVVVPKFMSVGHAVYQATEVPKCSWMQRLFPVSIDYPPVEFMVTR